MQAWLDNAVSTRVGEELDLESLGPYVRSHLRHIHGDAVMGDLVVEQFPSGFSNLTYLLRCGELELVLRRPPFGNRVKSAHDMGREYRVLKGLEAVYPLAPTPYLHCEDPEVIGAPFYIMERRRGIVLRRQLPSGLTLTPVIADRLSEAFIDNLAALHTLDVEATELSDLGHGKGYVERQVRGWIGRYEKAQTDSWPELDRTAAWLIDQLPMPAAIALIHNDYKYDNLLLDANDLTRLVAVLDWEMCTLGDPLMDLGSTLAYWVERRDDARLRAIAFGPTAVEGSWTRLQLAERYQERTGADLDNLLFYVCFGYFKLAVIGQQIYYRYFQGHTKDERFAQLNQMVGLLGEVAARAIDRGRL